MNRFARSAAVGGAALLALVLAIAASATSSGSDRSDAPSATGAVTNYLTYVKGKRGKADPKKPKVYIGWVNQQGGQVVIGGLATDGAELAVKYVNDQLGGVDGHPVALVTCFIKSNEEEGTTCGQKLVNDKESPSSARAPSPREPSPSTRRSAARSRSSPASPSPPSTECRRTPSSSSATRPHILLPFGTYAKNVLKAKTAAVVYPQATGITESALVIAAGLEDGRHRDEGCRLHAGTDRPDRAA